MFMISKKLEILKQGLQYESYLIRTFRDIPIISNKKLERYKDINIRENAQNIHRFKNKKK